MSSSARLLRWVEKKFLAPIYDARYAPEYTARGAFIGLLLALTPTVGIQIPVLMFIWPLVHRYAPRWDFNLLVAIAWTFVTNVFTVPLFYYLFIVTGRILLGRWENLNSFEIFAAKLPALDTSESPWYELLYDNMVSIIDQFGLPLFLGCVPWSLLGAILGYKACLLLIAKRRQSEGTWPHSPQAGNEE